MAVGIKGAEYESKYRVIPMSDDEAMEIERCVLLIRKVEPVLYKVIMLTYVYRLNREDIYRKLSVCKNTYDKYLNTAETLVKLMLMQQQCIMLA